MMQAGLLLGLCTQDDSNGPLRIRVQYSDYAHMRNSDFRLARLKMPDKPTWFGRLDDVISALEALPSPWVDRPTLELLLGVGRRAQQILAPCVTHRVGANG